MPKSCCARIAKLCCITEPLNKAEGKVKSSFLTTKHATVKRTFVLTDI